MQNESRPLGMAVIGLLALTAGEALADHPSIHLGTGPGGPITTIPGTTLPEGHVFIGLRAEHTEFDTIPDDRLSRLREARPEADIHSVGNLTSLSVHGSYGVSDDLTIGFTLPYVERRNVREAEHGDEHDHDEGGTHSEGEELPEVIDLGDPNGIGDLKAFVQYRFFHRPATETHLAAILGLQAPTGRSHEKSPGGKRLEQDLQPGSGSWDPLFGVAASRRRGFWGFDANVLYQLATEGDQDTDLGDALSYNAATSLRLLASGDGHRHGEDAPAGHDHPKLNLDVDLVLELNGEWRHEEEIAGTKNGDSGGHLLFLSPGIRTSGRNWAGNVSVGIPVIEDLNGVQVEPDWRVIGGVSVGF